MSCCGVCALSLAHVRPRAFFCEFLCVRVCECLSV